MPIYIYIYIYMPICVYTRYQYTRIIRDPYNVYKLLCNLFWSILCVDVRKCMYY